ncbi:hypothetical protein [Fibrobacter sp.]|uniref:hypothetical protein n=1 Tax=Fibrobacter sp. TaxID=35828 RepID=UPI0025BB8006|nr:hypothetical protein [Fibrobacter sp.]MBR3073472.1 hypothetical protein [Fibrobacter sp.]
MIKKILLPIITTVTIFLLNACDSSTSSEPEKTYSIPPTSFVINWNEKPQSCTAMFDKDTVFFDLTLKNWSWSEVFVFEGNRYSNTQTFKGLEESDLDFMCFYMKKSIESVGENTETIRVKNIACNGDIIIADYVMDATFADSFTPAVSASNMQSLCQYLLTEEMTLKEFFFGIK